MRDSSHAVRVSEVQVGASSVDLRVSGKEVGHGDRVVQEDDLTVVSGLDSVPPGVRGDILDAIFQCNTIRRTRKLTFHSWEWFQTGSASAQH